MAGVWSGFLSFGLVTLPVRLFSGARGERVSFHLLHAPDHARLKQQMVCPLDGAVVPRSQSVRGYEYAKGEYVVIDDKAIRAAAPASERQMEIVEFCPADQIDPVWFESSYYVLPEAAGQRPYALLLAAMQATSTWAVAQLSMHNREYLSVVRPSHLAGVPNSPGQGLLLHTLYYQDEIRVAQGFGSQHLDESKAPELKLAQQLIEGLTRPFDPTQFHDRYRKNLEAVVAAAVEGKPAPHAPSARKLAPVADLMESLKQSLKQQSSVNKKPAAKAKRPSPKRAQRAA